MTGWVCFPIPMKTPSASFHLDGKVDARIIYNRKRRLMAVQRRISKARNKAMVGRETTVLVEGPSSETDLLWEARMPGQAPEIDGVCYVSDFGERRRIRGSSGACVLRRRTITIWWAN